jgi:hypothetical protein
MKYKYLNMNAAEWYSVNSINLAKGVTNRIINGEFTWRDDFRDLHPSPFGQELCFKTIRYLFEMLWAKPVKAEMVLKGPHRVYYIERPRSEKFLPAMSPCTPKGTHSQRIWWRMESICGIFGACWAIPDQKPLKSTPISK